MNAMGISQFFTRQITQLQEEALPVVLVRKTKRLLLMISVRVPSLILAVPIVLVVRLVKPWVLVRLGDMHSLKLGHFAANTELYLCEMEAGINKPKGRYFDVFFYGFQVVCNQQLAIMWKRVLRIWPRWILEPVFRVNRFIPGGAMHEIGSNTQADRDVHNLLDRFPIHLQFTADEEQLGEANLRAMGIPFGESFVCLNVRDSAYHLDDNDSYRDSNIQNYVLATEELANRGYYVVRMGSKVRDVFGSRHPRVIDYAANGMRNDFMDVYLGAKCLFCISTATGWDAIPYIFRRPICYVNAMPIGYFMSFVAHTIWLSKRFWLKNQQTELSLSEIFFLDLGFCLCSSDYEAKGVNFIENTPEEIRDLVIEMAERLNGTWLADVADEKLQQRFWEIFPSDARDNNGCLHGEIRARYGALFLRQHPEWLQ